jgi:hypothetical protein
VNAATYPSADPGILLTMMKRRDLAWITDEHGDVVAVGIVEIDTTAQTVSHDLIVFENEQLHLPGVTLPQPV